MKWDYTIYGNINNKLMECKSKVTSITLCGDGDVGGLTVYNGQNSKGTIVTRLLVASGDTKTFTFGRGLNCINGLYVDVDNANSKYTVTVELIDEKAPV